MKSLIPVALGVIFILALIGWAHIESLYKPAKPEVTAKEVIRLSHPSMSRFITPEVIVPIGNDPDSILLIYSTDTMVYYRGEADYWLDTLTRRGFRRFSK